MANLQRLLALPTTAAFSGIDGKGFADDPAVQCAQKLAAKIGPVRLAKRHRRLFPLFALS